jgi:hypothetical protein
VVLECHLLCEDGEGDGMAISFQWLRGRERVLFEGFCSHVTRKIAVALKGDDALYNRS